MMHITARRALLPASVAALLSHGRDWFGFAVADATIEAHRARQHELVTASEAVVAAADAERRDLSTEERTTLSNNTAEVERLEGEIGLRQGVLNQSAMLATARGRRTAPEETPGDAAARQQDDAGGTAPTNAAPRTRTPGLATVPAQPNATAAGTWGFRNFGDYALAVARGSARGASPDRRLTNAAATTFSQESVGADGGFMVPPDFLATLTQRIFAEDSLLGRCDQQTCSGNTFSAPVDETTPWGTGGIKAYWESEASAISQSKPQLREINVRLHKLASLVPVTEEMLEDAGMIDGYLRSKMPEAIDWSVSMGITWGTGVGQPLGFMRSGALVTVAAENAQTADTINATNVVKMLARLPTRSRQNAVWLIHPDAEPQLPLMTIGQQPVYMPPGGLADAQYGRLLGRPVIPHQVCETVGDLGDIMLVDLSQYLAARKAAGIRLQTSMHLWFDQDLMAFKATLRLAGQPWWSAAIAQRDGSNTMSPFVTLAAR
jgi:HK97 family phage major capsid protein